MEATIRLYSSASDSGFLGFARALGDNLGREVLLLPLAQLPAPNLAYQQRQRLLVERAEVSEELNQVKAELAQPRGLDTGELNGLQFRRQALLNRRLAISRSLGEEGGPADG